MDFFVLWIISSFVGAAILSRYSKAGTGCLLGALLGPIGWIVAWVMRNTAQAEETRQRHAEQVAQMDRLAPHTPAVPQRGRERECPFCAELILAKARICKHCNHEVEPLPELATIKKALDHPDDELPSVFRPRKRH